jgi:hypothetical protein
MPRENDERTAKVLPVRRTWPSPQPCVTPNAGRYLLYPIAVLAVESADSRPIVSGEPDTLPGRLP